MKTPIVPTSSLVKDAITHKLAISKIEEQLKPITEELKERAKADTTNHVETKTGGKSWSMSDGRGHSVVISFPVPKRIEIADVASMKKLAGEFFGTLFEKSTTYTAVKDLATLAKKLLPKTRAAKVIEEATEESAPRLNYELKEGA